MWHALRAVAIPITVIGILPWGIQRGTHGPFAPASLPLAVAGSVLVLAGLALMAWTIGLFARVGKGTLAPWEPPRHLVMAGPYAHVRNPMISGGVCIVIGEALFFGSLPLAICAAVFFAVNAIYFPLSEEPGLAKRFGAEYAAYQANVPRWLPRWRAWRP